MKFWFSALLRTGWPKGLHQFHLIVGKNKALSSIELELPRSVIKCRPLSDTLISGSMTIRVDYDYNRLVERVVYSDVETRVIFDDPGLNIHAYQMKLPGIGLSRTGALKILVRRDHPDDDLERRSRYDFRPA